MTNGNKTSTWFDRLSSEIICEIFDYLSCNDIIYAFFSLSIRLNNLLLQHPRYISDLEVPTLSPEFWTHVLCIIGPTIKSLNISKVALLSLNLLPNLKSIILSVPSGLPQRSFRLIMGSNQFNNCDL